MKTFDVDGRKVYVDSEDAKILEVFPWYVQEYTVDREYVITTRGKLTIYLHRIIAGAADGARVVFVNGDQMDCRKNNLRVDERRVKGRTSTSDYRGVSWDRKSQKWRAFYWDVPTQRVIHIGSYLDEISAAMAYDEFVTDRLGEYARPNFEGSTRVPVPTS